MSRGEGKLLTDYPRLFVLAEPGQTLVVSMQAPHVAWVLAGPGERVIQAEVGTIDGSCLSDASTSG